ncbi:MAG TPA: hypothetical protein VEC02_00490 [Nitrososphaerales archaeon]|nr:hypothetical protein [Nitrososphaerales archaeon]
MAKTWEIRGLFGNEYAMGEVADELKKQAGLEAVVLDRRNLSIRLARRNEESEAIVRRTIEIHHGYVESEAPLGTYDDRRAAAKSKKAKEAAKKRHG